MSFLRHSAALLALVAAPAMAQSSLTVGPTGGTPDASYQMRGGIVITQSAGDTVQGGGVSCAATDTASGLTFTTPNSYLRVFDLAAEGLQEAITIQSIDFGIGRARLDSVAAGFVDTEMIVYRMAPGTAYQAGFPRTALTEVGRATYRVNEVSTPGGVFNVDMSGSGASLNPDDLMVVEWFVPDGTAPDDPVGFENGFDIRYGYNDEGALGSTYLSTNYIPDATNCGGMPPTPVELLGPTFADLHWVVIVNASLGVAVEGGAPGYTIRLGDAQPNPSVSSTRIPFTLETASAARVAVYDVLGREVAVLADGEFVAGDHEVRVAPGTLAPGTYVVRLATPSGMVAQTLTVTR